MSGICGILQFDGAPVDPDLLKKMAETSAFRGPHGIHYWIQGNIGLAHLALHTTPESLREQQPLCSARGGLVLVADARVDNRPELTGLLSAKGFLQAKDPTDADLILAAYECWGEDCPDQITGDFAFAIWDQSAQKLFCARDPMGVKQFHYHLDQHAFRFGTDVAQVLADERLSRDLDGYAVADFLLDNSRDQARTVFAAVQKLLSGHRLALEGSRPRSWRYWNPDRNSELHYSQDEQYAQHFGELLTRSISDRLRSVKGAAGVMTGGIDSSSIAAIAQNLYQQGKTKTRPIAYTHYNEEVPQGDEREYVSLLASELGIEFHPVSIRSLYFLDQLDNALPFLNLPAVVQPTPADRMAEANCDILLRGDFADVLFYHSRFEYRDFVRSGRWWKALPWAAAGRRQGNSWRFTLYKYFIAPLLPEGVFAGLERLRGREPFGHIHRWMLDEFLERSDARQRLVHQEYPRRYKSYARQLQYQDFICLLQQTSTANIFNTRSEWFGLETRFPYLDRRLAEFMLAAPLFIGSGPGPANYKRLLRQAMQGILPEKIRLRTDKRGGDAGLRKRLCEWNKDQILRIFLDTKLAKFQIIDGKILLEEFLDFCRSTGHYHAPMFFSGTLNLEVWLQKNIPDTAVLCFNHLEPWQIESERPG